MTDLPDLDRFRALADAYGGVIARWPAPDRDVAARIAATPEGAMILRAASALDMRLDEWRVPLPSDALRARIATGASGVAMRLRWWWSGIGIAAALAGAATGTAAVAIATPADTGAPATSFGDLAGPED